MLPKSSKNTRHSYPFHPQNTTNPVRLYPIEGTYPMKTKIIFSNVLWSIFMIFLSLSLWIIYPCSLYLYLVLGWFVLFVGAVIVESDEIPDMFE
jgi:hypothetical protein